MRCSTLFNFLTPRGETTRKAFPGIIGRAAATTLLIEGSIIALYGILKSWNDIGDALRHIGSVNTITDSSKPPSYNEKVETLIGGLDLLGIGFVFFTAAYSFLWACKRESTPSNNNLRAPFLTPEHTSISVAEARGAAGPSQPVAAAQLSAGDRTALQALARLGNPN